MSNHLQILPRQVCKKKKKVRIRHHSEHLILSYSGVFSYSIQTALGMAVKVFQVSDSDSAGVVKMNILRCSLRDFCSARRLNSCCSPGAALPPMVDSRGCTWQHLMCESVKCGVLFFTFSQSKSWCWTCCKWMFGPPHRPKRQHPSSSVC